LGIATEISAFGSEDIWCYN